MIRHYFGIARITIFILLSLAAFSACGKNNFKSGGKESNTGDYKLKDDETIIDVGTHMEWVFGKDYKPWTPGSEDIEKADEMIKKCFDDQANGTVNRVLDRKPDDYCKQFVGAVNSNGERILWVNCFCKKELEMFKKWKTDIIFVADGGNCFLQIKFNWDKNDGHYELKVNGGP